MCRALRLHPALECIRVRWRLVRERNVGAPRKVQVEGREAVYSKKVPRIGVRAAHRLWCLRHPREQQNALTLSAAGTYHVGMWRWMVARPPCLREAANEAPERALVRAWKVHAVVARRLTQCALAMSWLACCGLAMGCDDAGKHAVQARVPALAPTADPPTASFDAGDGQKSTAQQTLPNGSLPLKNELARPSVSLLPAVPSSKA